jgi:hypothetical protein
MREAIDDSWWAALVGRVLPQTQVQIIEALRVIDRPLTAGELFLVFDKEPVWLAFCRHVRRLTDLRVIALAERPSGSNPLETPYRLVAREVKGQP